RVDLEYGWQHGRPRPLQEYQQRFPALFADPGCRGAVAFEEYRLRRQAGENTTPAEYREKFNMEVADWPVFAEPEPKADGADAAYAAASAYRVWRTASSAKALGCLEFGSEGGGLSAEQVDWFRQVHRWNPQAAQDLAWAVTALPEIGSDFLGFRLE